MSGRKGVIVLGNQLFDPKKYHWAKGFPIVMIESDDLCSHFTYHKHKLILFLSSMRVFADEMRNNGFDVHYFKLKKGGTEQVYLDRLKQFLRDKELTELSCFEIEDHFFEKKVRDFCRDHKITLSMKSSPMFLTTHEQFTNQISLKRPFMKSFYEKQRKRLKVLVDQNEKPIEGKWSFDADNRKKIPKSMDVPRVNFVKEIEMDILSDVKDLVNTRFESHPGDSDNFYLAISRNQVRKNWTEFLENRLVYFGDYEDAMQSGEAFLFHSVLSPGINMGLLTPDEVMRDLLLAYKKGAPINAVEGFVRQVIGWREFIRGIYHNFDDRQQSENFWNHQRKLNNAWYEGTTGIDPLDDCIKRVLKYGYCHHIERLMLVGAIMLMSELHPQEVYRWFMELFVDSSDWVMGPNVFGMSQFSDGGIFATKPYLCGSNYILKMSNYKKGEWCETMDGLYWRFIDKHREFFLKNPRMSLSVRSFDKMDDAKKHRILTKADGFIDRNTE